MWLLLRVPLYLWGLSYRLLSLRTNIHSWDYIPIFLISWNLKIWQVSIWGNASKGTLWCVWTQSCFLKGCFLLMLACFLLDFLLSTGWDIWFFFSIGFLVSLVLKFLVDFSYDFSSMCFSFFFLRFFDVNHFLKSLLNFLLYCVYFIFCFVFCFWPWSMWDFSSPIRDWTYIPFIGRWWLNIGPPGKSTTVFS